MALMWSANVRGDIVTGGTKVCEGNEAPQSLTSGGLNLLPGSTEAGQAHIGKANAAGMAWEKVWVSRWDRVGPDWRVQTQMEWAVFSHSVDSVT